MRGCQNIFLFLALANKCVYVPVSCSHEVRAQRGRGLNARRSFFLGKERIYIE